ncbi:MAG: type II toxin-antitoxin system Phd/YefM family antitoxin [Acidobacteriaceae bacterium]|nr:type II toxin-antitoxin system Phd/YefM family antitoxin [Acidobacteriaceae bacterium]MBV9939049.1 type II toxin-antitoxin system Phd/YefM family antitoxin [Acidobacteriaceae bacterium]
MAQFNTHEAKNNFSHLLELVERGEEVIVARHGKSVARLVGLQEKKVFSASVSETLIIGLACPQRATSCDQRRFHSRLFQGHLHCIW